jgi:FixJ family two-component response regulator
MQAQAFSPANERISLGLVDDDADLRRSLQLLLRSINYDVRAYTTGAALLADGGSRRCACLITDLHMRGLDGIELLRRLRSDGWHGPAILITSLGGPDVASRDFFAVLRKPLVDREVLAAVGRAISDTGTRG